MDGDKGNYFDRSLDEYESSAKDPANNFGINEKSRIERQAGLELEARGDLPGPIVWDSDPAGAEFIDANGVKWDVKSCILNMHQWVQSDGQTGEKLDIVKVKICELHFTGMHLSCLEIVESNMNNSFLIKNDMSDCYFFSTSFDESNLSECMQSKTVFDYGSLKQSKLRNCVGIKASCDDANLCFAD